MTEKKYRKALLFAALGMAIAIALPYALYHFHPEYRRLVPFRTPDDGFYMGRLDAVLQGHFREFQNGITGGNPPASGIAPALLELIFGTLFSWTRLHGPQVSVLLTVLIAPLTIPLLSTLLRRSGVKKEIAIGGSILYALIFLSPLERPIYMSLALPFTLTALLLTLKAWQNPSPLFSLLAILFLGIIPGVYFWSFSFTWGTAFFLLLLHLLLTPPSPEKRAQTKRLLLMGLLTFIVSLPFLLKLLLPSLTLSFASEISLRNQVVPTRLIESPIRSSLLTLLTIFSLLLVWKKKKRGDDISSAILPLALVLSAFTVMHQNLVHGLLLTFSSHYYPFVCLAALLMATWAFTQPKKEKLAQGVILIASIFLLAGAWDYRLSWTLLTAPSSHLTFQHLLQAIRVLNNGEREAVLTDYRSAQMVTNWTDDDTVFTPYVRHLLVSNEEFAERYCLTEAFAPRGPDILWLAREATHTRATEFLSDREEEFGKICSDFLSDLPAALRKYDVDLLLWNKRERPEWKIDEKLFMQIANSDTWALYRIR